MKKYQLYIDARFANSKQKQWQLLRLLKNGSFKNRENLQYIIYGNSRLTETVHENKWKVQQFSQPLAPA